MAVGWVPRSAPFLVLVGLMGFWLLWFQSKRAHHWLATTYVFLLLWNGLTTFWIYKATLPGALFTVVANALLYWLVVAVCGWWVRQNLSLRLGTWSVLVGWLAMEWIHFHWELHWPWLTLGFALAQTPWFVQWYEWTGVQGGSLWLLVLSLVGVQTIHWERSVHFRGRAAFWFGFLIVVPIAISLFLGWRATHLWKEGGRCPLRLGAHILQPNVDPYSEKFVTQAGVLNRELLALARASFRSVEVDSGLPQLIVTPETAVPIGIWLHKIQQDTLLLPWREWARRHPCLHIILGFNGMQRYTRETVTPTARVVPLGGDTLRYDAFNSALLIAPDTWWVYHKALLVPGVETLPWHKWTAPLLGDLMLDLGGISGTLGTPTVFPQLRLKVRSCSQSGNSPVRSSGQGNEHALTILTVICYESVFPEYLRDRLHDSTALIAIITNDGWWGRTDGHRQHFHYARVQAITFRKWIVRAANTGISGVIDPLGQIIARTQYDEQTFLYREVPLCPGKTFFARVGNAIGRTAIFLWVLLLVLTGVARLSQRFRWHPKVWRRLD